MTRFVGRNDYVDPVVADPTWGVSDQDMFDRAVQELGALAPDEPFYALLQTLSNHTPMRCRTRCRCRRSPAMARRMRT